MNFLPILRDPAGNVQVSAVPDDGSSRPEGSAVAVDLGRGVGAGTALTTSDGAEAGHLRVPGPDAAVWDVCGWLDGLREVPADAAWPRLMTLPHPDAVGSYGAEVEAQYRRRTGRELRWWQRLAAARLLEHDERGRLLWLIALLSTSRQVGKSVLLRELMEWRTRQMARWGDQLVVHTGKDLAIVQEVMQPAMTYAERAGVHVEWRAGQWVIERTHEAPGPPPEPCERCSGSGKLTDGPCGTCGGSGEVSEPGELLRGRWIARQHRAVYGYSATLATVDEAWKVPPRAVDDGLLPTLVEQESPQLALVSTAHPEATGLMLDRRVIALGQLFSPQDTLMLEWSAPTDLDLGDRRGWRMASPHWSPQRERLIAGALRKAQQGSSDPEDPDPVGSFRCQWLNQWPQDVEAPVDPDEVLATEEEWARCLDPAAPVAAGRTLVVAVEDDRGRGAAAAAAGLTADGRVVVGGWRFDSLREAVDWCEDTAGEDGLLLAGASLVGSADLPMDPELEGVDLPVEPAGGVETRDGLPQLRALVRAGRLAHDGSPDVSQAVLAARVRTSKAGALLVDPDVLLRCVVWAARRAHRDRD